MGGIAKDSARIRTWRKVREGKPSLTTDGAFEVPLTRGAVAIVDLADAESVSQWSWSLWSIRNKQYARANVGLNNGTRRYVAMHFYLIGQKDMEVDHANGDGLDNRRSNLRVCTHQQNMRNMTRLVTGSSPFKGVSWFRRDQCWRAYIVSDAKQKHLGYFVDEIEAARAYDKAAREFFGEFALLNFPESK